MGKNIQIPLDLYEAMVTYICNHYDPVDRDLHQWICNGIRIKERNIIRRNLFSAYKTETDSETKETLRQAYLDETGIPSHGRWSAEIDIAIHNGEIL